MRDAAAFQQAAVSWAASRLNPPLQKCSRHAKFGSSSQDVSREPAGGLRILRLARN